LSQPFPSCKRIYKQTCRQTDTQTKLLYLILWCVFQSVSVDGSTTSFKSRDEENNTSMLSAHGVSSQQFVDMSLMSFRPTYLFLARIPLDIIHECLKLRLEQRPDKDPSLLSLQSVGHVSAAGSCIFSGCIWALEF